MGKKPLMELPPGITLRERGGWARLRIAFTWNGIACREQLPTTTINKSSIQYAASLRDEIRRKIDAGTFVYAEYFPDSPRAKIADEKSPTVGHLLQLQLKTYERQVENGKLSKSTKDGYKKRIKSDRMAYWDDIKVTDVTPAQIRAWISDMDCTSKTIRNMLTPLKSVFDDALNDELITFNPFDRVALSKLIRQFSKASDYVIDPFNQAERLLLLNACRPDERPLLQFWINTGLRPGELQAIEWRHIDYQARTARVELNQVAGVIKLPKTAAGIRLVDLNETAIGALKEQEAISKPRGDRIWLNPRDLKPWQTDAQVRKTWWQPLTERACIKYRNPYQLRHTYASILLTAGGNPWYVASQLGHEDVEMVFRTYGKFIREDFQQPKLQSSLATQSKDSAG